MKTFLTEVSNVPLDGTVYTIYSPIQFCQLCRLNIISIKISKLRLCYDKHTRSMFLFVYVVVYYILYCLDNRLFTFSKD